MSAPDPASVALARQMPWTVAEPESIWLITGALNPKHEFENTLAIRIPDFITGGHVLFRFIGMGDEVISPSMITRGQELILTMASNPLAAFFTRDQHLIDRALEELHS